MIVTLVVILLAVALGLSFVLGAPGLVILPIAVVIALVAFVSWALFTRGRATEPVREVHEAELLGPGGPDDPKNTPNP